MILINVHVFKKCLQFEKMFAKLKNLSEFKKCSQFEKMFMERKDVHDFQKVFTNSHNVQF